MLEIHDADVLVDAVRDGDTYAYWAPGDATVYRVTLVRQARFGHEALLRDDDMVLLLVMVGTYGYERHVLLQAPHADHDRWTPEAFANAFGVDYVGWWSGVRPLLASLGWTTDEHASTRYDPSDAIDLDEL